MMALPHMACNVRRSSLQSEQVANQHTFSEEKWIDREVDEATVESSLSQLVHPTEQDCLRSSQKARPKTNKSFRGSAGVDDNAIKLQQEVRSTLFTKQKSRRRLEVPKLCFQLHMQTLRNSWFMQLDICCTQQIKL